MNRCHNLVITKIISLLLEYVCILLLNGITIKTVRDFRI
jgi:hypothetical protein